MKVLKPYAYLFFLWVIMMVLLGLIVSSCKSAPAMVLEAPKPVLDWGHPDWSERLVLNITKRLSDFDQAQDLAKYCPSYKSLSESDRAFVWATVFVAVAKRESGYDPKNGMTEKTGAYSQGLFQLTYGDNHCPKKKSDGDLNSPFVNIDCAVSIAADLVKRDQVMASGGYVQYGAPKAKGMAAYWSVLRVPDKKSKHHLAEIIAKISALKLCGGK